MCTDMSTAQENIWPGSLFYINILINRIKWYTTYSNFCLYILTTGRYISSVYAMRYD